jgi:hypothetical protein
VVAASSARESEARVRSDFEQSLGQSS